MQAQKLEYEVLNNRDGIAFFHRGHPQENEFVYHDFIMIAYVAHGEGNHYCNGTSEIANEGDIFIINPYVTHSFCSSKRMQFIEMYYCLFIPSEYKNLLDTLKEDFPELEPFLSQKEKGYIKITDNENKELRNLFIYAIDEFMHCPPSNKNLVKSYFTILLTKCLRKYQRSLNNPVFNQNKTVDEIIRYINYNLNFGVSTHDIAEANNLSEPYLCRLFKKHTGVTITQFINNLKIEKAKDILQNTDRSIESISITLNCLSLIHI